MEGSPFNGRNTPELDQIPSGHMNLLDMMNWSLYVFTMAIRLLRQEIYEGIRHASVNAAEILQDVDRERLIANLKGVERECAKLGLDGADQRLGRIFTSLRTGPTPTYAFLVRELTTLHETIEDGIETEYFYHYPHHKGVLLLRVPGDWGKALAAFPSAKNEIEAAVDCFAMEHNTVCVFHMMRAAEVGLRAIAREQKIKTVRSKTPIEWGTWNDVLRAVEQQLRRIRNATAGPKKDAALAFYNGAMSDLRALQDLYRDRTMHLRESYDEGQAQSAMHRVRSLLHNLASRLNEANARQIRWGV
jgi:hypothetical protein